MADETERAPAPQREERSAKEGGSALAPVVRDMAVGAVAGAVLGAAWRVVRAVQPDRMETAKASVIGAAKEIGAAAGAAVRDVLASKPIHEVLSGKGEDGKGADLMKSTLKEAAAAAGDAAKGVLESKGAGRARREE